ncbi:formate dehydrogenase subunit gamma [Roseovarius faecimaris]|uniref:Formate dehydrogenase subunit gamma n=1 Tax=Roseovarius faecimaris TaxID=2494550 RepID=A0A6I6INE8_9RHOB|nr:formate dehydrogenase subunit gamma [Roseovarius faecimaris]QGX97037.1 formate dehydrogenase subunit gamma [Roseovarius faecimaris]
MFRALIALLLTVFLMTPALAQEAADGAAAPDRSATGGAQTLEDIMARQRGEKVDNSFRSSVTGDPDSAAAMTEQLGTLGGASDPDLWRGIRFDSADITSQVRGPAATVLVQDGGMKWLQFREGPLATYGGYAMLGTLLALLLFYVIRGKIRIGGEKTGRTVTRFKSVERFGHWLLAGSFIVLGITGLISLFGRKVLIPAFGHDAFSTIAVASKWVHNNVAWAFILGLIMIFVMWVIHNLPDRTDINWALKGGGIFTDAHPPAKKFNAGQKLIFWSCIVLGGSISLTGLALLFPFEINLFAGTFEKMNAFGISALLGLGELNTVLAPHEEMQLAQAWHAIVSFALMVIILAHIYIGSIGMEGAFDAMGTGEVEEQWAREHHSIWAEEAMAARDDKAKGTAPDGATPAE